MILLNRPVAEEAQPCRAGRVWRATFFCMVLSSSLKLTFTFKSCWIFASEAARAFFTCRYSWAVMGPSDKSESRLCKKPTPPFTPAHTLSPTHPLRAMCLKLDSVQLRRFRDLVWALARMQGR